MEHFRNINGRKEVRADRKGKIRVFLFSVETGSGPEGRETRGYFHKLTAEGTSCHGCIATAFSQPFWARDEGTFWQLAAATLNALESFQDWEPRNSELPGLGTKEFQ